MPLTGIDGEIIKESWINAYYEAIWNEADSYFTEEVVGEWHENMSLYHNVNYRANKLTWQADVQEPITADLVSKLSNFFTRLLVADSTPNKPFFKFNIPNAKVKAQAYTELVNATIEANNYSRVIFNESLKKALDSYTLPGTISDALTSADSGLLFSISLSYTGRTLIVKESTVRERAFRYSQITLLSIEI